MSPEPDHRSTSRLEALYDECLARAQRGDPLDDLSPAVDADWLRALRDLARAAGPAATATPGPSLEPEPELPWAWLGGYRLVRRLGEGGMGVVYMAEQPALGRFVALKVLRPEFAFAPSARARFEREARAIARLQHQNIVSVHAFGEDQGVRFLAMDLLPGDNLDTLIAHADGGLPIAAVLSYGTQIADALATAHAAGILHRDVKPSNIRVLPDGRALLLDFGLARDQSAGDPTLTREFVGSPAYAAPEQIAPVANRGLDARADVYSLAATLYEALTGEPPFRGDGFAALTHQVLRGEPRPPRRLRPELSADVQTVLLHGLEKAPSHRYDSAAALAADLRALAEFRPIQARAPGLLTWLRKTRRRYPAITVLALCGLAALVALAGHGIAVALRAHARAAELVAGTRAALAEIESGQAKRQRDAWHHADLDELRVQRGWTSAERSRAERLRGEIDAYDQQRTTVMARAQDDLRAAAELYAGAHDLDQAWAHLYFLRWFELRNTEQRGALEFFRRGVLTHDRDGSWARRLGGQGTWRLTTEPAGAEVFLFQYALASDVFPDAEPRVVPMRAFGAAERARAGSAALRVVRPHDNFAVGDLLLPGDDGAPLVPGDTHRARVWHDGDITLRDIPAELDLRATFAPLLVCADRRAGTTPIVDHSLQPAWYVAVIRKPGFETLVLPFHVDHAAEHFAACAQLAATLLPLGTTPHGFVRVAAEAFSWREQGFYLQEREVTCAEYAAFLATCATPEFRPAGPAWTWRDGAGAFVGSDEQRAEPVVGVSWAAATAFCRWVDAHWPKPPGHRCALPSTLQWTRAAKGGDGRTFVFGNELRMEWVRRAAAPDDRPSPVLSHPHDESPWGAFDLAGSVAEWCDDGADTETAPVCGGSWRDRHAAAFRSLPRQVPKVTCSDSIGFRVVWRRSEDLR